MPNTHAVTKLTVDLEIANLEGKFETPEQLLDWVRCCLNCNTNRVTVGVAMHEAQQPAVPEDVARVNKQMLEALRIVRDTLPHINGNTSSVNSLLKLTGAAIDAARNNP